MSRAPAATARARAAAAANVATTRKKAAAVAAAAASTSQDSTPAGSAPASPSSLGGPNKSQTHDYSDSSDDDEGAGTPSDDVDLIEGGTSGQQEGEEEAVLGDEDMEQGEGSADLTGLAGQKKRIPAFVRKLRSMLDNKDVIQIKWTPDGAAFRVFDSVTFSRDVLPNYFKHNNWQSFIRQLNIYGFIKLTDAMHTAAVSHSNSTPQSDWSFRHPLFLRKYPRRMEEIKRRAPKTPKLDFDGTWNAAKARVGAISSAASAGASAKSNGSSALHSAADVITGNDSININGASKARTASGKPKSSSSAASSTSSGSSTAVESAGSGERKGSSKAAAAAPAATSVNSRSQRQARSQAQQHSQHQQAQQQPIGPATVKSLEVQVKSLQSQIGSMQRKMRGMAKAQARAISLTAGVLATQLEGRDSSVASIQELQESLTNWQRVCASAATERNGSLTLRLRASNNKRSHASDSSTGDYDALGYLPQFTDSEAVVDDSEEGEDDDDEEEENDELDDGHGMEERAEGGQAARDKLPQVPINAVGMVIDTGFLQQQPPHSQADTGITLAPMHHHQMPMAMTPLSVPGMPHAMQHVHAANPHALQLFHSQSPAPQQPAIRLGDDPNQETSDDNDDSDEQTFPAAKRRRSQ